GTRERARDPGGLGRGGWGAAARGAGPGQQRRPCARAGRHRMTTTKNRKRRAPPRARRAPAGPRRRRPGGPRRGGGIVRAMLRPMAAVLVPLLLAACSRAQPGAPDAPGSAAPAPAAAGELTAEEQAIARAVDAEEERALALL